MGVMAEFKVEGLEELQRRINEKKQVLKTVLDMKLLQLCEEAVAHAKINKGYQDHTANLKNSISFALYYDGKPIRIHEGKIPKPDEVPSGMRSAKESLEAYSSQSGVVAQSGYTLIIVAGMEYGKYVEDRGYNVLHLTRYFLKDELEKILKETLEDILG